MIQHAIAVLFGITQPTPIKYAWVAITVANVVMMFWLSMIVVGYWQKAACRYFLLMGMVTIVQGSWLWGEAPEVLLAVYSAVWIWYMLPRDKHGRIFALSIGLVITCVLMLAVPPPWPHYDPAMYYTRLYSTAAFLGIVFGASLAPHVFGKDGNRTESHSVDPGTNGAEADRKSEYALTVKSPINSSILIAIPWFIAVLIAGSQRGWDRWYVGIYTNLMWSACLICWLALARRADRVALSTPDAQGAHRQSAQYLP